jgi:hypothetical protein
MVEEIIGRLPYLTGAQLGRLEDEIRRELRRRASSGGGGRDARRIQQVAAPALTEVLEYRPHEDGYLQLELRRYVRRSTTSRSSGPICPRSSYRRCARPSPTSGREAGASGPRAIRWQGGCAGFG